MELGWPFPKRKKYLEEKMVENNAQPKHRMWFQNKIQEFPIHHIPAGLPKYRLENGRTLAAQAQYISANKLDSDFFSKDTESDVAQSAQHEILKEMLKEKGLFDYFKNNDQVDPIVLTNNGYIVDGNRRLCALRELFETGDPKFSKYSHVDVVILPAADQKDIDELEARIQVHKDIKADYTWYSTALMLKHRQTDYNYTDEDLSSLYDMKETEIRELLDMLSYAELYLEDRDKPLQYNLLEGREFAFRQLAKRRGKIGDEAHKEVFERVAFCLIDESEGGRLYQHIPDAADHLDRIIEVLKDEFDVEESVPTEEAHDLLGGESSGALDGVINVLYDEENYDKVRTIAYDVIEGERVKQKEKKKRNFVFSQIKKANALLAEATMGINSDTRKEGIEAQLQAIDGSLEKIREWLGNGDQD